MPPEENSVALKQAVRAYWERRSCGTSVTEREKFSRAYFDEIEAHRYRVEPEIFSFAQFTRHHGERMLEVGVGAGTDFLQWVRAGCRACGVDITEEGIGHVRRRLNLYGLKAEELRVADAENLPYPDASFDLVYSWGVIHHTPDTEKALAELLRVLRPGGTLKVMIYHRRSLVAFFLWVRRALLMGRPWKSFAWCLWRHMESPGTKAYTRGEVMAMLARLPVENVRIRTILTHYDVLGKFPSPLPWIGAFFAWILGGNRVGWFLTMEAKKK